jgi:hypothetical protein
LPKAVRRTRARGGANKQYWSGYWRAESYGPHATLDERNCIMSYQRFAALVAKRLAALVVKRFAALVVKRLAALVMLSTAIVADVAVDVHCYCC